MCHISQQKSNNKNLGVIYKIQKNICASPNTSRVMISLKRTGTWEGAFNLQHICRLFGLPHQVMRPINIEFIALFVTIIKSSTIFMSRSLICAIKPHIGAFFAEKLTVDQKYPSRKSVNKSNNYTSNEYNPNLLMIITTQLKYGKHFLLMWDIYEFYTRFITSYLYLQKFLDNNKPTTETHVREQFYSSLPLSQIFYPPHQLLKKTSSEKQVCSYCFKIPNVSQPDEH